MKVKASLLGWGGVSEHDNLTFDETPELFTCKKHVNTKHNVYRKYKIYQDMFPRVHQTQC